jgi:hydrogenase expression/formation protein HypE
MVGKLDPETLTEAVFSRAGATDERVTLGPGIGEDAAGISLGEQSLVVSSDPISLAAAQAGRLGVPVACNDVAATGADPAWLTSTIFLTGEDRAQLETITGQLDQAATALDVAIVGGHTEIVPELSRPLLSLTAMGLTDRIIPSGGASVGDRVLLTKGAGIEGTGILATDFREQLDVPEAVIDRAVDFFDDISVTADARAVREYATALHDPTEGGVVNGLVELALAGDVTIEVTRDAVPIREETGTICDAVGVDPLRIFGSGALLATVPEGDVEAARSVLSAAGITAAVVGRVTGDDEAALVLDGDVITGPQRDEMYALWE